MGLNLQEQFVELADGVPSIFLADEQSSKLPSLVVQKDAGELGCGCLSRWTPRQHSAASETVRWAGWNRAKSSTGAHSEIFGESWGRKSRVG